MPEGVLALSHDLGTVTNEQSVNFAVGYARENAINYLEKAYTGYYRAQYPDTNQAVSYFLDEYKDALQESSVFDSEMARKAKAIAGRKYADIVTLSARQAFGGIDLTIPSDTFDAEEQACETPPPSKRSASSSQRHQPARRRRCAESRRDMGRQRAHPQLE